MATLKARYKKRTESGGDFILELYDDGTLKEWSADSPDDTWSGTWQAGGKMSTMWSLRTQIGPHFNEYSWGSRESIELPSGVATTIRKLPID